MSIFNAVRVRQLVKYMTKDCNSQTSIETRTQKEMLEILTVTSITLCQVIQISNLLQLTVYKHSHEQRNSFET